MGEPTDQTTLPGKPSLQPAGLPVVAPPAGRKLDGVQSPPSPGSLGAAGSKAGTGAGASLPTLTLAKIWFGENKLPLWRDASKHTTAPGNLQGWARGNRMTDPEWLASRPDTFPTTCVRNQPLSMRATLAWPAKTAMSGVLTVTPTLNNDAKILTAVTVPFAAKAGDAEIAVIVRLMGKMPNEIGRFPLALRFEATATSGGFTFRSVKTEHLIFCAYDLPVDPDDKAEPDYDGIVPFFPNFPERIYTGTPQRLKKLMALLGKPGRHPVATQDELKELFWKVHTGINDHQSPPFFDAIHNVHITNNGGPTREFNTYTHSWEPPGAGAPIDVEDQWLMWVPTPEPHWNTAACIGYAQLMKTMLASVGIFTRRAWVYPHTGLLPNRKTASPTDDEVVAIGVDDGSKAQTWELEVPGKGKHKAQVRLMEPKQSYENFEACLRTPGGRLLPGAYSSTGIEKDAPDFIKDRGFKSPLEVLRWWCRTKRDHGKFQRFMCWVAIDDSKAAKHCWDVDGTYYPIEKYEQIFAKGKQLPPP